MKAIIKLCKNTYKVFINDELKADYSTLQDAKAHVAGVDLKREKARFSCPAIDRRTHVWRD